MSTKCCRRPDCVRPVSVWRWAGCCSARAPAISQVSVDGTKTYFDTNVSAHHHFYLENSHELVDIPDPHLVLQKMPEVPEGYEIARVDMVVRLRKKR